MGSRQMANNDTSTARRLGSRVILPLGLTATLTIASCRNSGDGPARDHESDGGAGGEGGTHEPSVPPGDRGDTVPVFGGVAAGRVVEEGILLEWYPAADAETPRANLVYVAYVGVGDGPVDLSRRVAVSLPGADSLLITGLKPADYRFVVRVRDEDGNEDTNIAAVRVSTRDDTPPEFAGIVGAVAPDPGHFRAEWERARDDTTPFYRLRYRVYQGSSHDSVFAGEPVLETEEGADSALVDVMPTWPGSWLGVRAVDESGNEDQNDRATFIATPDGVGPNFAGLLSVSATRSGVLLRWPPATDSVTPSNEIRYRVFYSKASGMQNFSRPRVVSERGVTQVLLTDLDLGTEYFFIVRAEDGDGNTDANTIEKSVQTLPRDETPPLFDGAQAAESFSPTSVRVSWSSGSDMETQSQQLRYEIFVAEDPDSFDLSAPRWVTPPGRLSADLLGLEPETDYSVLVRAIDPSGNESELKDALQVQTLAKTGDVVPPSLSGGVTAALVPSDSGLLLVSWAGAVDDVSLGQGLRGHVCAGTLPSDCQGQKFFANYNATSAFGAASVFVSGLLPRTTYYVALRLEDEGGNYGAVHQTSGFTATSYVMNVEPILTVRCNQCHSYTYGTIVNIFEDEYTDPVYGDLYLVDTNNVTQSYLLRKLRPQADIASPFSLAEPASYLGARMPSDGSSFLGLEVEQIIIDWIDQGAFFN